MDPTPNGTQPRTDWTPNGTEPRMDPTPHGTEPRMGLNPEWTEPRMDLNPTGTQPRMDSTPNGLNPDWDSTSNGLNPDWDSTPGWDWTLNGTQPRHFPLNAFQYGVNIVSGGGVHQKNGLFKRELLGVESWVGTQPRLRLNPPLRTELRIWTQPRYFPLNPSNMVYNNVSRRCT